MVLRVKKSRPPFSKYVFYYWKILGMCPFSIDKTEMIRRSPFGTVHTSVLIIGLTILYRRAAIKRWAFALPRETNMTIITDFIGLGLEYIVITVTWLYAIMNQNKLRIILKAFQSTKNNAVRLGMAEYYDDVSINLSIYVFAINFMYFVVYTCEHAVEYNAPEFDMTLWLAFNIQRCISLNMVAVFVYSMKTVKAKFKFINLKIQDFPYDRCTDELRTCKTFQEQK